MKLLSLFGAMMLLSFSILADHHDKKDEKKVGHDKEHQHVKKGADHEHDESHHQEHDHKAHHPGHDEDMARDKKHKVKK